jgi:hypothetical protein
MSRIQNDQVLADLESPYSRFPNPDGSQDFQLGNQSVNVILTERQQQLDAVLHDISGLDSVIDRIKTHRQQLVEKHDEIIQCMTLHRGYTSALWRLPVEVLSQIFVHCLPPETDHFQVSQKLAPIVLTRICRRWRDIVVNMPSLWCRLFVTIRPWQRVSPWYDLWLMRSRERPISLAIHCFPDSSANLRSLLHPYSTRISSLQIILDDDTIALPKLLFKHFPALQEITLEWRRGSYESYDETAIVQFISRLPCSLRDLRLQGIMANPFSFSTCNVWAHLTNVKITVHRLHEFIQLLQLCPNLSSLDIGLSYQSAVAQPLEPFSHANLQSLSIACPRLWSTSRPDLFNALTLPNLRVLEARYLGVLPHEEFKAFLVRSGCPLECLILGRGVMMTDEQRAECMTLIPSLDVAYDESAMLGVEYYCVARDI